MGMGLGGIGERAKLGKRRCAEVENEDWFWGLTKYRVCGIMGLTRWAFCWRKNITNIIKCISRGLRLRFGKVPLKIGKANSTFLGHLGKANSTIWKELIMEKEIKIDYDEEYVGVTTGDYLPIRAGSKILPPERVNQMRQYAQRSSQTFEEKNNAYRDTLEVRGQFFSVLVRETEELWGGLSEPTIGKLIFLATFMDKNNCICFDGGWETVTEGKKKKIVRKSRPMSKSDIRELLQVSKPTFYQFWNECVEKKAVVETENGIYLPRTMIRFCDNSNINTSKVRMIKVFKHAVRYMYENTDERSKKSLTNLYRLIPFINLKYNILCENPFEAERENIIPLTAADICEKLGLDRKFHERVVKALKKLSFVDMQGNLRSVITYRWDRKNGEERYWITINPQFYSGYIGETEMMQMLDDFCYDEKELEMYDL